MQCAFQTEISGQEYVRVKAFKMRIQMCKGTLEIHPSVKET